MIIAFDVHGVLDSMPYMRDIAKETYENFNDKMYLISGSLFDSNMQKLLKSYNIRFDKYFSITQELLSVDPELVSWEGGTPHADNDLWDSMKAIICKREKVDILFDDSPCYRKYFKNINTTYVEIHNGSWHESGRCQR